VVVGLVFHAGGKLWHIQPEGFGACNLTFDAALPTTVPEYVVVVVPECALLTRTLGAEGQGTGLTAEDGVLSINQFDLAVVDVGGFNLLGRTKGPAPTAGSLEVAIVDHCDESVLGTEDVPVAT